MKCVDIKISIYMCGYIDIDIGTIYIYIIFIRVNEIKYLGTNLHKK